LENIVGTKTGGINMRKNNKKVTKALIISNIIFVILLTTIIIVNYKNYNSYIGSQRDLIDTKDKLKNYENKISELNKKINTKDSDKTGQINEVSTQFLNAFFNYDALSKNKIYCHKFYSYLKHHS